MSQREAILKHLRSGSSITQAHAVSYFGCYRLSERIREIEASGVAITHEQIPNASGRGKHARYSLAQCAKLTNSETAHSSMPPGSHAQNLGDCTPTVASASDTIASAISRDEKVTVMTTPIIEGSPDAN